MVVCICHLNIGGKFKLGGFIYIYVYMYVYVCIHTHTLSLSLHYVCKEAYKISFFFIFS
jgi:hypothetical protein